MQKMKIFLTGNPGCGKSTLVRDLIQALKAKEVAGIVTPEIRDNGRTGFQIIDLASGREEMLASVDIQSGPRVGKYRVNVQGIDRIVDLFRDSMRAAEIIFLDEVGRMELFSQKFRDMAEEVIQSDKPVVTVLHRELVRNYENKGEIIWVERERIDQIKDHVLKAIHPFLEHSSA